MSDPHRKEARPAFNKYVFHSRGHAWRITAKMLATDILTTRPYKCHSGGELHWHIGHTPVKRAIREWKRRLSWWFLGPYKRFILWPFYRLRKKARRLRL